MAGLKSFFYRFYGGLLGSVASSAIIYLTGYLELIGSVDQILYLIAGLVAGILVFNIAGILTARFSGHPVTISFLIFAITLAAYFILSPADRIVTDTTVMLQIFLLLGVFSFSAAISYSLILHENRKSNIVKNGLALVGWSFIFTFAIILAYQFLSDSRFSLITLAGEILLTTFTIVIIAAEVKNRGTGRGKMPDQQ